MSDNKPKTLQQSIDDIKQHLNNSDISSREENEKILNLLEELEKSKDLESNKLDEVLQKIDNIEKKSNNEEQKNLSLEETLNKISDKLRISQQNVQPRRIPGIKLLDEHTKTRTIDFFIHGKQKLFMGDSKLIKTYKIISLILLVLFIVIFLLPVRIGSVTVSFPNNIILKIPVSIFIFKCAIRFINLGKVMTMKLPFFKVQSMAHIDASGNVLRTEFNGYPCLLHFIDLSIKLLYMLGLFSFAVTYSIWQFYLLFVIALIYYIYNMVSKMAFADYDFEHLICYNKEILVNNIYSKEWYVIKKVNNEIYINGEKAKTDMLDRATLIYNSCYKES